MRIKSILIVDDDISIRDIIRTSFERHFTIVEAATYFDTMNLRTQSIDLAIIDYLLPDRDGFEVLRSLREHNPSLPVIMVTGHGNEDIIIRALRRNVTDYMPKPLNLKYLRQRVAGILRVDDSGNDEGRFSCKGDHLDNIAKIIQDNYGENITLDMLARSAGMSRFSLCRAFKERFNQCLTSYINGIRMKNAEELLRNQDVSITEIAFSVGYRSSGHFNRVFKATYKMSPREYRRKTLVKDDDCV